LVLFFKKNCFLPQPPASSGDYLRKQETPTMIDAIGYAAKDRHSKLKPHRFQCDEPGAHDVQIDIMFCGVCHSDIHQVKNEWGNTVYPCLPGHEIVGRAVRIGPEVTRIRVGDIVGVGCMIDSCRTCEACRAGAENYCLGPNSWLATYNGPMKPKSKAETGENMYGRDNTFGGYSSTIVVREDFILKIPAALKPEAAAPILCAGVTTFSPMRHWGVKAGHRVGIIGFGGLGDMASKLARGLGAHVTIFTRSRDKIEEGERIGVDRVVLESDEDAMGKLAGSFDFILSTVPEKHDLNPFTPLLKWNGVLVVVGALEPLAPVNNMYLAMQRLSIGGSLIGSIAETQEVLDFCAEHRISPDIEMIGIEEINHAYEKVENGEVRFRYVIDMATLKDAA
jgi:uncharacterized zinc-type alcohol dehydrogenase-like protein